MIRLSFDLNRNKIFLIFFFFLSFASFSQETAKVSGLVKDANGLPIPAVVVMMDSIHKTLSDLEGMYLFDNVTLGSHVITVASSFSGTYSGRIEVVSDLQHSFQIEAGAVVQDTVEIKYSKYNDFGIEKMQDVENYTLTAGMKTEVVSPDEMVINSSTNNAREGYSKISGANVWESDNYGIQLGLGVRGLSPNRSANFNVRQNGYDIAADAIGYPESYYTPAFAALSKIEIIRGAASLQFGPQFGGMLNFRFKKGNEDYPFESVVRQSLGSFGFAGTFVSFGGQNKKLNYYSYYNYKRADGWRPNNHFDHHNAFVGLDYELSKKLTVNFEYTFMDYLAQQPGGLTDDQFEEDPQQSTRARNWFEVNWNLFALSFDYEITKRTSLNVRNFGLIASRKALGNLTQIDRPDINGTRNLIVDEYKNIGNETRILTKYVLFKDSSRRADTSAFVAGIRVYKGKTNSEQGVGSNGNDANFEYIGIDVTNLDDAESGSKYDFPNFNFAAFVENQFKLNSKWSFVPGARFEYISTQAEGYYTNVVKDLAGNFLGADTTFENISNQRSFLLLGLGISHNLSDVTEIYGNVTQNYRPVTFSDIRIDNPNKVVDPSISDENGFNADLGLRGTIMEKMFFDVTTFYMQYNDRIGSIYEAQNVSPFKELKVVRNIADADIYGVEAFVETDLIKLFSNSKKDTKNKLNYFINTSIMSAHYVNSESTIIQGKEIELVPSFTFRTGATFKFHDKLNFSLLFTYIDEQYSDATNRRNPVSDAVIGLIPSYYVLDFGTSYEISKSVKLEAGINNLTDNRYFTRRADGYPGPGIVPSDALSFYATLQVKFNKDTFKKK